MDQQNNQSKVYKSPVKHRHTRRAFFQDYRAPGMYMMTITKAEGIPLFSELAGNPYLREGPDAPHVAHFRAGDIVKEELDKMESFRPDNIKIIKSVVMPDHVHVLIRVLKYIEHPVTKYVGQTMAACTARMRREGLIGAGLSCFKEGISDSIVYKRGQMDILYNYICDNPRRLMIKRLYPSLFKRYLGLRIDEFELDAVGNIFLLRKPLHAVHVRRKWNAEERERYKARCFEIMEKGWVLISPFIHPVEKEIMREALEKGGSVIKLCDRGFGERWKPAGKEFDLCAEGRMLFMVEAGTSEVRTDMTYVKASHSNKIAEKIAHNRGLSMAIRKGRVSDVLEG